MRVDDSLSDRVCVSSGSLQGCVLSPLFFILYTNDRRSCCENRLFFFVKFSDDTAVVSLVLGDQDEHGPVVSDFVKCHNESYL